MKYLKVLLLDLFVLLYGVHFVFGSGFYITQEQMKTLTNEINNITSSNKNLITKLQLQQEQYQILITTYENKYTLAQEQLQTYKNSLKTSKDKESIYKYCIGIGFALGVLLGVVVAK